MLTRECRCVEVDVWDPDSDSESDTSSESENEGDDGAKTSRIGRLSKKFKKEVGHLKSRARGTSQSTPPTTSGVDKMSKIDQQQAKARSVKCEPRVLHGFTATKEVAFRTVCETIRQYAFRTT